MIEDQRNNPLHGVKLEALLTELVTHYGFPILAEQININCFKSNPSISSSLKFLRKTPWARDRLEAFYLYKYKQLPRPTDKEHRLPPRDRSIPLDQSTDSPAVIDSGQGEFFDDPLSGPKPPIKSASRRGVELAAKSAAKKPRRQPAKKIEQSAGDDPQSTGPTPDPWAGWRARLKDKTDE